ncbi:MAG TPA: SDR family oxidoreductase [Candidatus Polarisedimenticolia bacterium]|jgi:acetoacetyl-CoA reductase/3-oxoacyl-[acyl-carrier protein] reductase|nr:SDR family oxidoreductase [Candidatus Polarisedimenticolia bacterium]
MKGLEKRVMLVTGGGRGIGATVVEKLREAGAIVAYTWKEHEGKHLDLALQVDVRDARAMEEAVDHVERQLGPIEGVVANAGITADGFLKKLDAAAWQDVIDTNLTGVYNTLRPTVTRMHQRKAGAAVVVSSIVGERGNIGQANYAASKAGVIGLVKALARESARYGVRINAVAPGFIETDMLKTIPEPVRERIRAEIPIQRFGQPEEIAQAILFLLSPVTSSFITGEVLRVNGGHHM